MKRKKLFLFFCLILLLFVSLSIYIKLHNKNEMVEEIQTETETYKSNMIDDVEYVARDSKGNEYKINAISGEIDLDSNNVIFLTDVSANIILKNSNNIYITSDFGKYNTLNYDTIFSKNVIIKYLDNKINSEYLDFSIKRNNMIVSKDVIYTNPENILKADVIEIEIDTKDTKIFMHENKKKVNIKSKNYNGNN